MEPTRERVLRAEHVIAEVDARWGAPCGGCSVALIGHDVVLSLLMGLSGAPRCAACLASGVGDELLPFLRRAHANVRRLDCYGAGWRHSDRRVSRELGEWPEARIPGALRLDMDEMDADETNEDGADARVVADDRAGKVVTGDGATDRPTASHPVQPSHELPHAAEWDAGDMGCGDLVLELRGRLGALQPGDVLLVRATDPGAPGDIPAWCRVTRNPLCRTEHPRYWIQRRADP